jgi:hypoxanthine phosphoribosyltransferase
MVMQAHFKRIIYAEPAIRAAIRRTARRLSRDYAGKTPVVVGILKGAAYYLVHLTQAMTIPLEVEFVTASSYGNAKTSSGRVRRARALGFPVKGRHILLVDDILDTGRTLSVFHKAFERQGAASVRSAVLFDKQEARQVPYEADYPGLPVPDVWLTGCGLDTGGLYRNLTSVGVLKKDATS